MQLAGEQKDGMGKDCKGQKSTGRIARLAYLEIILPGHVGVNMAFGGPVNRGGLAFERRF